MALLLAVAQAALLTVGPTADARAAFRFVADGSVMTDGVRWAVIGGERDTSGSLSLQVIDTKRRASFKLSSPDPSCFLHAVGAGQLTWSCQAMAGDRLVVTSLSTRRSREAKGFARLRDRYPDASFAPVAIGRRWIEVEVTISAWTLRAFLDRRTGRIVPDGPDSRRERADLDSHDLVHRLCAPLRRRRPEGWEAAYHPDPVVSGKWALFENAVLRRCGSRRGRRLPGCKADSCSPQFGAGYVTWITPSGVRAYYPPRRRSLRLGRVRGAQPARVQHTRSHVFATGEDGRTYVTSIR